MSSFIEIPMLISSSSSAGAFNISPGYDKFDVSFANEIKIPAHARNITVEVANASIWHTAFNISTVLNNNKFYLDVNFDTVYTVTIPDGLYDLTSLAAAINVSLVNQNLPSNVISFTSDSATQKVIINYSVMGLRVDFSQADTFRVILGFNSAVVPTAYTTDNVSIYADVSAYFNLIDYFLIHSSIVSGGLSINGTLSSIAARVLITSTMGSQIIFEPHLPTRIPCGHLAGSTVSRLHSWLTDQDGGAVNTNNEDWSYLLIVRFQL